ncbi:MAG: HAD-IA family hydrolase [Paludibacteraceae bacterium]|nr:HAD-IA family hydrolase [Paludibacteraceae bacterium]
MVKSSNQSIILDLGGVLMQHNMPGCISKFRQLLGEHFSMLGLDNSGEAKAASIMHDYEIGFATTHQFVQFILPYCLPGTTPEQILDAWNTMHAGIPAERIRIVQHLAERYPLYLLSNNNEAHWLDVTTHYPELIACFSDIFLSHQLHLCKPNPSIFEEVNRRLSIANPSFRPTDVLFVDDLEANCSAARHHGWQTCLSLSQLMHLLQNP